MSWFSNIFSGGVSDVVDSVTGGLDKLFTSDEERLQAEAIIPRIKAELEAKLTEMENQLETYIQGQLTERHKTDMQSDSWLSKNIRPLSLLHVTFIIDVVIVLAYFGLVLEASLVGLVGGAWSLMNMFYFGGRTLEKGAKMISGIVRKK